MFQADRLSCFHVSESLFCTTLVNRRRLHLYTGTTEHIGVVGERLKPLVLKTGVHFVDREFESRPLRHKISAEL